MLIVFQDMHRSHIAEAKQLGLPADSVPAISVPSHDDMDRELRLLAQQQEKLLAQMQKAAAEQNNKSLPGYDVDMEQRIKAMRLGKDKEQLMIASMKLHSSNVAKQEQKLKDLLNSRKNRGRKRDPKGLENLTDQERKEVMETHQTQMEADRLKEDNAMLEALSSLEEVGSYPFYGLCYWFDWGTLVIWEYIILQDDACKAQMDALRRSLEGSTEEEVQRLLSEYDSQLFASQAAIKDQRNAQRDTMLAKLAARRRMKEEITKENAVSSELDNITKAQVRNLIISNVVAK